ncbi:MAG: topoisomerase DNA-binding C4 zinc finger domain-containing protein, partial [Rhodospirillales bacterium]|nr:topoisomerase DNA-binding C4 zinc finger domain-containing protein [Rhodospirillales bacterium]
DREYVKLDSRRFVPEDRGRLVTAFLENFFNRYVQYNFTADLENQLDDISGGRIDWKEVLRDFWKHFFASVDDTKELRVSQVLDTLDQELGPHFFPELAGGADPRQCPTCANGRLSLKLGKFGAFIGCSNYPECRYTRPLTVASDGGTAPEEALEGPKVLGNDPETGLQVALRKGPYGHYVQLGEAEGGKGKEKPKRVSLFRGLEPAQVDLQTALRLLALPRSIGKHPETEKDILAGIGKFGPYLKHDNVYKSLTKGDDVLTIGLNRAVDLLADARKKGPSGRTIGEHPEDGKPVTLNKGRFGPYVAHEKIYATLPRDRDPETVTLEEAVEMLAAKSAKGGGTRKKAPARKAAKAETESKPRPARKSKAAAAAPTTEAAEPKPRKRAAPKKKAAIEE